MNAVIPPGDSLSVEILRELDQICLRFERAWVPGHSPTPRIEDYLGPASEPVRSALLRDLLLVEWDILRRNGGSPRVSDYLKRFPGERRVVMETFGLPDVPGFEVQAKLGEGGMGVVFQARHRTLNRPVALKMLRAGVKETDQEVLRFRFELEAMATLDHPHVAQVYEVGEYRGLPFGCLRYYEGGSMAAQVEGGAMPGLEAARQMALVARAVHHAHQRGILHRDLKPHNILLDAEGQPHVTDFGLARRLGEETGLTSTQHVVGSPPYMAPEQALGKRGGVTTATDVYGLGATLYELITGQPPFRGETPIETLQQVLGQEPLEPRVLNAKLDRRLEAICLKCLHKEPGKRYRSAEDVAEDLDNYRLGRRVNAESFRLVDAAIALINARHGMEGFGRLSGVMLVLMAAFQLSWAFLQYWLFETEQAEGWIWASIFFPYFVLFGAMGVVRSGRQRFFRTVERHHWSLWIGHLLGCAVILIAGRFFLAFPGWNPSSENEKLLAMFPAAVALTGTVLFVQGSQFLGRYYLFGLAFFALALVMPLNLRIAPLEFGLLMSLITLVVGLQILLVSRRQAKAGN